MSLQSMCDRGSLRGFMKGEKNNFRVASCSRSSCARAHPVFEICPVAGETQGSDLTAPGSSELLPVGLTPNSSTRAPSRAKPRITPGSSARAGAFQSARPIRQTCGLRPPQETLHALAVVHLAGVQVTARIDGEIMDPVELARITARAPELRQHGTGIAR